MQTLIVHTAIRAAYSPFLISSFRGEASTHASRESLLEFEVNRVRRIINNICVSMREGREDGSEGRGGREARVSRICLSRTQSCFLSKLSSIRAARRAHLLPVVRERRAFCTLAVQLVSLSLMIKRDAWPRAARRLPSAGMTEERNFDRARFREGTKAAHE